MSATDPQNATQSPAYLLLRYVLEALSEDKDQLFIEESVDALGTLLTVRVSERDMGKLIGKSGQTVKALRTLLRVIGGNSAQRINLKILEPEKS